MQAPLWKPSWQRFLFKHVSLLGWMCAAGMILIGMALRSMALRRGLWFDEYVTLRKLSVSSLDETLQNLRNDTHHPLYFILLCLWSKINSTVPFLRFLSVVFDTITLAALMIWLRSYGWPVALSAGLYMVSAPIFLRFGLELRPYALLTLTSVLSFWATAYLCAEPDQKKRYLLLALAWILLISTHPVGILLLPIEALGLVFYTFHTKSSLRWREFILINLVCGVLFGFYHWIYTTPLSTKYIGWMPKFSGSLAFHTLCYLLHADVRFILSWPSWLDHFFQIGLFLGLGLALALGSWRRSWIFLAVALGFAGVVSLYSVGVMPIFWYRVLLPSMVALLVFMAVHIHSIPVRRIRHGMVAGWVALCTLQTYAWVHRTAFQPVEASHSLVDLLQKQWSLTAGSKLALFYPDYFHVSLLPELPHLLQERLLPLTTPPSDIVDIKDIKHIFFLIRVDLSMVQDPTLIRPFILSLLKTIPASLPIEVILLLSHDLDVIGQTSPTLQAFLAVLNAPLGLPQHLEDTPPGLQHLLYKNRP